MEGTGRVSSPGFPLRVTRELSLSQRPDDALQRPGSSRRRRSRSNEDLPPRVRRRVSPTRALVILLEEETSAQDGSAELFEGIFVDDHASIHMWSRLPGLGHYRWLQGPVTLLSPERRIDYLIYATQQIRNFLFPVPPATLPRNPVPIVPLDDPPREILPRDSADEPSTTLSLGRPPPAGT